MGLVKNAKTAAPAKAPNMGGKPAPVTPPPITKLPPNADAGTATGAPTPEKGKRSPRALIEKTMSDGAVIKEAKGIAVVEGINFKVSRFGISWGEGDERNGTRGSLRDAISYWHSKQPAGAKRSRAANPMGTLSLLRAGKAIKAVADLRAPEMRDALNAALAALRSDLDWQIGQGVKVADIENAEAKRIETLRATKAAAKNATPAAE